MAYKRNNQKNNSNNKEPKPKRGRPSSYNPKLFPKQAYIACSELGAFNKDLAKLFNVTTETIKQWARENKDFSLSIKRGVIEYGNKVAVKSLRKLIEGFYYNEVTLEGGKETKRVIKYQPPTVAALAFWLKNKWRNGDPDDPEDTGWKDYRAVEIGNLDGKPFVTKKHDLSNMSREELKKLAATLESTEIK